MKENLEFLRDRGIKIPVILGGAALNKKYVEEDLVKSYDGKVHYAKDAFAGLQIMKSL